jgi:hypothetical protein
VSYLKIETEQIIAAAERYAVARYAAHPCEARDDQDWWRRQRAAARAYAELARIAGRPRVSLVRGFIPAERIMTCGCYPQRWDVMNVLYTRRHSAADHAELRAYEAAEHDPAPSPE